MTETGPDPRVEVRRQSPMFTPSAQRPESPGSDIQCPNTSVDDATGAFGRQDDDGNVKFFDRVLPLPDSVRPTLIARGALQSIRLTGPCLRGECLNFRGGICLLGKLVSDLADDGDDCLPACPIRAKCRWFDENGAAACQTCPQITYEGDHSWDLPWQTDRLK